MEHLIQPIPGPQCCRMQSRWHCSAGKKNVCTVAHSRNFHTRHLSHATLSHTHTYIHTYLHTYIHTYVRTRILSFHIPSCFVTRCLSHSTLSHTTVLPCRSFTTSFVFPSFPVPATTFEAQYWKKLTCGVVRSFNLCFYSPTYLIYRSFFIPIYRSIYLPTFLSTYLSIYLSIYLSN